MFESTWSHFEYISYILMKEILHGGYSRWRDSVGYLVDLPRGRGGGVLVGRVAPETFVARVISCVTVIQGDQ